MTISHDLLRLKLAESLAAEPPALTRRDIRLPGILGKAFAVIGVRRGGKTSTEARAFLVTLDAVPPSRPMPQGLIWAPAAQWLWEEL